MTDRMAESERLSPGLGLHAGTFWDLRAERYAASMRHADAEGDPFLRRLRRLTDRFSTVIDVGAGSGRFALALAATVGHVTAVDRSPSMLAILRAEADRLGIDNVTTVPAPWEEAGTPVADVVFSAFVLPLVPDARPFVSRLEASAREHVLLYLGAYSGDAVLDPLWRHFHGRPRSPGASYLDALALLREMGIAPHVEVVETVNRRRFATVADAVDHYRDGLLLDDTPQVRRELEGLLATWLLGRRGALRSPLRTSPAAIIRWRPRQRPPADAVPLRRRSGA